MDDPDSTAFVAAFLDRTLRPEQPDAQADQFAAVMRQLEVGSFLSPLDGVLLRLGRRLAPIAPRIVMPLAQRRIRQIVGHLVAPADPAALGSHMAALAAPDRRLNVNLLGEAVLGRAEANRRFDALAEMLRQPDVDYVSVKLSSIVGRVPAWDHERSVELLADRLGRLLDAATDTDPRTFVNVDMEEYAELDATIEAFVRALDVPHRFDHSAGIVLQAYLPEALPRLQELSQWASERAGRGGGHIKVRLVKGANLAMELAHAERHGWPLPTVADKVEADANFKRCIDWLLHHEHLDGLRLGVASHNLFDIAWTLLVAEARGVSDHVEFEMLQGMAPAYARLTAERSSRALVSYTPAVSATEFDVALGYLFRRLEENAAPGHFMRDIEALDDPEVFARHADVFRESLRRSRTDAPRSPRTQDRSLAPLPSTGVETPFANEAETDPAIASNRAWMAALAASPSGDATSAVVTELDEPGLEQTLSELRDGARSWSQASALQRAAALDRCGDEIAKRRGEFIATMVSEAHKTVGEADVEVAEAIDFARYYARQALDLETVPAELTPFGTVAVCSPWNFPVAIACGGVFAALAAGNTVALKPSPMTRRCARLIVDACRAAGLGDDTVAFTPIPDGELGRRLVTDADAVIMTGSTATADRFVEWKPDMRLFAETSGKNALIVTPSADLDQAAADLVASAFGHSGQKCSAASLAILVGDVGRSERFVRQVVDAVRSLTVGPAAELATDVGPLIGAPNDRLARAFEQTDPSDWLVTPLRMSGSGHHLWSPGVLADVQPGSWFHQTECFGPVLGLMRAETLDEAIDLANASEFGLTGGIHSLDPAEIERWLERIEVGNAYVNRSITGAIVQRQPFGGWKRSAVGPGAKAGGPNYVAQFGTWSSPSGPGDDYEVAHREHFAVLHDPSGLRTESNVFRYVPITGMVVRIEADADPHEVELARRAAFVSGVPLFESLADEPVSALVERLPDLHASGAERLLVIGGSNEVDLGLRRAAHRLSMPLLADPVVGEGRIELVHWHREQAVSQTLHRFGSTLGQHAAIEAVHQRGRARPAASPSRELP